MRQEEEEEEDEAEVGVVDPSSWSPLQDLLNDLALGARGAAEGADRSDRLLRGGLRADMVARGRGWRKAVLGASGHKCHLGLIASSLQNATLSH